MEKCLLFVSCFVFFNVATKASLASLFFCSIAIAEGDTAIIALRRSSKLSRQYGGRTAMPLRCIRDICLCAAGSIR